MAQAALWQDGRVLLRYPNFRRLLSVRLLSQLADGVFQVALATYVVFSPQSEATPGAIAAAMAVLLLPYSLLGPFAGVLLDRWRRRQVLLYGNLLRTVLASSTAALMLSGVPDAFFYLSALSVTAVNRFILAGLSASLPRVVDSERLVMANSVSPTAGTLAATLGGGAALGLRGLLPAGFADAGVVLAAASLYLLSGLAALSMARDLLGPEPSRVQPRVFAAIAGTVRGLAAGLGHLRERRRAAGSLAAMALMRFCYGALTVMLLMLCRYAWSGEGTAAGATLLGLAVGVSGLGFFVAAVLTPWATRCFGRLGWMTRCAATAAVLVPLLVLSFAPVPTLGAAFVVGVATQGAKIATDTVVQSSVDDAFRGRVFALYDMLFNVAFVGAAAVAALVLPADGRSGPLVLGVAALYALIAVAIRTFRRPECHTKATARL